MIHLISEDEISIGRLVAERPARSAVFERFGIDYCCGGKKSLAAACAAQNLSIRTVLIALDECDRSASETEQDWDQASLTELADHIAQTYHARLRETLPRLTALTEKVANAHGDRHPKLLRVRNIFHDFRPEMKAHTAKEEQVLFPLCRELGAADVGTGRGTVAALVQEMEADHDGAGDALLEIRTLTKDFKLPQGGCNTYRAMLQALADLELDTHRHVQAENSILFPNAVARESALAAAGGTQ